MVAREDTISWGENKPIFRYFLATILHNSWKFWPGLCPTQDTWHACQKMGTVYAGPKPSMHRPFKKTILIKKIETKN